MTTSATTSSNRWFQPAEADPDATLRLFLFPHAGSGASIYKDWPGLLPTDIAHHCVQLPGRQDRAAEESFTEMQPLVTALCEAIGAELDDRPYAFFGHCMGAQLAYRLALQLQQAGQAGPVLIGVSGWAPKDFRTPTLEQARMPVEELMDWIRALGSVPKEIMDDQKAMAMIIPAMRADLAVVASYQDDGGVLTCPVVAYSGRFDQLMLPGAMESWVPRTPRFLGNSEFPGDHFYMNDMDNAVAVTTDLLRHVRRLAAGRG
jgi:surfactin synthase thioesterase subunit